MPREITQDVRSDIYRTEMYKVPIEALTFTHPDEPEPIRVVNNTQSIEFEGNTFLPVSFSFTLPAQGDDNDGRAQLSICNIDRNIVSLIRSISGVIQVSYEVFLVGDTVVREVGPYDFDFRGATYTSETVTGQLVYTFYKDRRLSTVRYTLDKFPGLRGK